MYPLKPLLLSAALLLGIGVNAQTYQEVTTVPPSSIPVIQNLTANNVQITSVNSATAGTSTPIPPSTSSCITNRFWAGNPSLSGFMYQFTSPISHIRLNVTDIDTNELLLVKINGMPYTLTSGNVTSYSSCTAPATTDISNGKLTSFSLATTGKAAQINIMPGFSMNSVEVLGDSSIGGVIYEFFFVNDTCNAYSITASNNNPCFGDSLKLFATSIPAASYLWSGPNGFSSNLQNPVVPSVGYLDSGAYTVVATRGICNYSDNDTVHLKALPEPLKPTSSSPLCPGSTLQLTAPSATATTYKWKGPASFTSTLQNPTVPNVGVNNVGRYYLRTVVNGCTSMPDSVDVILQSSTPTPTASNNGPACPNSGSSVQLSATTVTGATYIWSGPNGYSNATQSPTLSNVTMLDSGMYYVSANKNNCNSLPDSTLVDIKILTPTPDAGKDTVFCPGTTLYLTATTIANAQYKWTGPGITVTQSTPGLSLSNVSVTDAGMYYVTATVNNCVSRIDSVKVDIIISTPTPVAGNDTIVCPGSNVALNATANAADSYSWSGPGFTYTGALSNALVNNISPANAGAYVVTATIDGCTSLPDTMNVTVDVTTPTPEGNSNSPVCEGEELQLSSTTIDGATYQWIGPDNFVANTQTPTLSKVGPGKSGTYYVRALIDGCTSLFDSVDVRIKPAPQLTATNSGPVCEGENLTITATGSATYYKWTGPSAIDATGNEVVFTAVTPSASGTYSVSGVLDGCKSLSDATTYALVNYLPEAPVATSNSPKSKPRKIGDDIQLQAGVKDSNVTYMWSGPDNFSSMLSDPTIRSATKPVEGVYKLVITDKAGCSSFDTAYVGVTDKKFYQIYPNPNNGNFSVIASILEDQEIPIEVLNAAGGTIYRSSGRSNGKLLKQDFNFKGSLAPGMYFLRLAMKDETWNIRFVVGE